MIDHLDAVELATRRVLEEFAADNVIYLELRTTPRHVDGKMEQIQHVFLSIEHFLPFHFLVLHYLFIT